jgi:hypothetical protein
MNGSQIGVLFASLCTAAAVNAQSMFRGDAMHSGRYAGPAPRQFHRVKWKFPTGDRVMSSPVFKDNVIYFGGDDGNVYAVDAETGRQIWKRDERAGSRDTGNRGRHALHRQLRRKVLRARYADRRIKVEGYD